jgi:hypothetical protein|tara:strand:- start:404 stop:586 length:183 start_codon:yes stop_codon:yes gene_type:complete
MYVLFCYGVYGYYETYNEALSMKKILEKKGYKDVLSIEKMENYQDAEKIYAKGEKNEIRT